MSVTLLKCLLPLACAVHLALLYCDRIITLLDGGRFDFRLLNNKKTLCRHGRNAYGKADALDGAG